jgi:flagellar biosynthesis/type III secretory pathway ATPase
VHSAPLATSINEYFRDQGKNVLLLMDSLALVSHAQREIARSGGPEARAARRPATRRFHIGVSRTGETAAARRRLTAVLCRRG